MPRVIYLTRRPSSPPETCIVNDAHIGVRGICGRTAAHHRRCSEPVCVGHLCQFRGLNGHRCRKKPLRLLHGTLYHAAGWFPNTRESAYCVDHEVYNCVGFDNSDRTVRCSRTKVPGKDHCFAHAAALCKWQADNGRLCDAEARKGSEYCREHCCIIEPSPGVRCALPKCRSTFCCTLHRCAWKSREGIRCQSTSFPDSPGVCGRHVCAKEGCRRAAWHGADRC